MRRDAFQNLPDDIAARIDRRGVMFEAADHVSKLHRATDQLGDALVAAGLPGREWRSEDAVLSLLATSLPDIDVDALITRLAEFAADTGPTWLHGDERDLETFHEEVAILRDVVRPLRVVAQRLRMASERERGDLPIERAFGHVRVATPLDLVASLLRDLELLAPVMAPLTPEEWDPPPASSPAPMPPGPVSYEPAPANAGRPVGPRLRDFAPARPVGDGATFATRIRKTLPAMMRHYSEQVSDRIQTHRLMVAAGIVVVLATGVAIMQLVGGRQAAPSPLIASPAQLSVPCASQRHHATLILKNMGQQGTAWMVTVPSGLGIAPTHGTLAPGQSAALQVTAATRSDQSGALDITASGTLTVPYSVNCS